MRSPSSHVFKWPLVSGPSINWHPVAHLGRRPLTGGAGGGAPPAARHHSARYFFSYRFNAVISHTSIGGADIFWRALDDDFHSDDWRTRFSAAEKVTLMFRFLEDKPVRKSQALRLGF